jgi:hypothetical protein
MSPEEEYLAWRKQGEIGCVFAQIIARRPARLGQRVETIIDDLPPTELATEISRRIDVMMAEAETVVGAVLVPRVSTLADAARTFLALRDQEGWEVATSLIPPPPAGDWVAMNITRTIPFGTTTCPSEALVAGPFEDFPPTRRAPILAIELYVGEPRPFDPKTSTIPTTKANVAHVEMNLPTHRAFREIWRRSEIGRRASLGGDDNRAKAKVSFLLTRDLAEQLGCLP